MGDQDVWNVAQTAPYARLYLTHFDNVAHATITRHSMRGKLLNYQILTNYDIPEDSETINY